MPWRSMSATGAPSRAQVPPDQVSTSTDAAAFSRWCHATMGSPAGSACETVTLVLRVIGPPPRAVPRRSQRPEFQRFTSIAEVETVAAATHPSA